MLGDLRIITERGGGGEGGGNAIHTCSRGAAMRGANMRSITGIRRPLNTSALFASLPGR